MVRILYALTSSKASALSGFTSRRDLESWEAEGMWPAILNWPELIGGTGRGQNYQPQVETALDNC